MARRRWGDRSSYGGYGGWAPYVPVAKRRAQAAAYARDLSKKSGRKLIPVVAEGRTIARSPWGIAWCDNLESYSDFANRLPRGRTYIRNGSVIDLQIVAGKIKALVSGSEVYELSIAIETLAPKKWTSIQCDCASSIASLIDLLQGRFDKGVMERLSRSGDGLFPHPKEIKIQCSCPDYAVLCKHAAAILYGVGVRLDQEPELLFKLRNVDHLELVSQAAANGNLDKAMTGDSSNTLQSSELSDIFGIELDATPSAPTNGRSRKARSMEPAAAATRQRNGKKAAATVRTRVRNVSKAKTTSTAQKSASSSAKKSKVATVPAARVVAKKPASKSPKPARTKRVRVG